MTALTSSALYASWASLLDQTFELEMVFCNSILKTYSNRLKHIIYNAWVHGVVKDEVEFKIWSTREFHNYALNLIVNWSIICYGKRSSFCDFLKYHLCRRMPLGMVVPSCVESMKMNYIFILHCTIHHLAIMCIIVKGNWWSQCFESTAYMHAYPSVTLGILD